MSLPVEPRHEEFMRAALDEARTAYRIGEMPVGAVIVHGGAIIARGHNVTERGPDPTAHAEIAAIRAACAALGRRKLTDCILYTTLYPCPMCEMVIREVELGEVFFGGNTVRWVREVKFANGPFAPQGPLLDGDCRGLFLRKLEEMGRHDILDHEAVRHENDA